MFDMKGIVSPISKLFTQTKSSSERCDIRVYTKPSINVEITSDENNILIINLIILKAL
jgi:hypothetical protein